MQDQVRRRRKRLREVERQVDDAVCDRLARRVHRVRRVRIVGLRKGQFQPLGEEGRRVRHQTTTRIRQEHLVHRRGRPSIHQVPQSTGTLVEPSKHLTGIGHHQVLGGVPLERVLDDTRAVARFFNPDLHVAHLAATEARERDRLVDGVRQRNHHLLLREFYGVAQRRFRHIHTTSQCVALVVKHHLLATELAEGQRRGGRAESRRSHREQGGDGVQLHRDLALLGQQVRRQGRILALRRRDRVGQSQPHIRTLGYRKVALCRRRTHRSLTAESQQVIARGGVRRLADAVLEELLTRQEIGGAATVAEGHLADRTVAPATGQT